MGDGRCRCCCISYRTRITLFAVTNVFLAAVQLILPLIPSGFILYFTATRQKLEAKYILHEETMSIFTRIPSFVFRPMDTSRISPFELEGRGVSALQSDLHVWTTFLFLRGIMLGYSVLLYCGARNRNYGFLVSWIALNIPVALHSLLFLGMDYSLGLMWRKPLNFQVYQISLCAYQWLGILFVYCYIRRLGYRVRYSEYKREDRDAGGGKFRDPASLHFMYGPNRRNFEVDERLYQEYE